MSTTSDQKIYFKNRYKDYRIRRKVNPDRLSTENLIHSYIEEICTRHKPLLLNSGGGIYSGCAGIAYMFYYTYKSTCLQSSKMSVIIKLLIRRLPYCKII